MFTIDVKASKNYSIYIEPGCLGNLDRFIDRIFSGQKIIIVSDDNVYPIYGQTVKNSLEKENRTVFEYIIEAGEKSKNPQNLIQILEFCAEKKLTRNDFLIALGGGVVGDITGLAASLYLRGIEYVQIPTTLLAQVDSAVGGKTAVDLNAGKNLMGTFYQPSMVLVDTETLKTLPEDIFNDGCAEVIKYSILAGGDLYQFVSDGIKKNLDFIVFNCLSIKNKYVQNDEFDRGERKKLNLGHTVGHAIERLSNYTVSHGKAVSAGTCLIAEAAYKNGDCSRQTYEDIVRLFKENSLPTTFAYSTEKLYNYAANDKKIENSTISVIVPEAIGKCMIKKMEMDEFKHFISRAES